MDTTETAPTTFKLREPVASILLEDHLSAIPSEVETANALAVAAWDSFQQAGAQLRHARAEQKLAPGLDAAADNAATEAGKEMPKERAQSAAHEAVALAARREQVARAHARGTQLDLAHSVNRHRGAWIREQESGVIAAAQGECVEILRNLEVALSALSRERVLLDGLKEFPVAGALDYCQMGRYTPYRSTPSPALEPAELFTARVREPPELTIEVSTDVMALVLLFNDQPLALGIT
jgi:hypothetical protein